MAASLALPEGLDAIIADCTRILDGVAGGSTFETVIAPLMQMDRDMEARTSSITFVKNVSTDKGVRDASNAAQAALSAFEVKAGMRVDVYAAVKRYAEETNPSLEGLDAEAKRFVERTLRDYRRRGLHLDATTREQVEALETRVSDLCVEFQKNLAEDATKLYFTTQALGGMPADFVGALSTITLGASADEDAKVKAAGNASDLSGLAPGSVLHEVSLSYPHVVPLLKLCSVPSTRAAVEKAFNSRAAPANTHLLEAIVALRRELAHLLGYANHSHFILEERMAGTEATVNTFLSDLARDLRPLADADIASLTTLKHAEEGADSGSLTMADYRYYMEKELVSKYSVDHDAIKAYFPLEVVVSSMLDIYQRMLSLRFTLVATGGVGAATTAAGTAAAVAPGDGAVWHEDVSLYAVHDARDGHEGEPIGFFYLDLHPREGKYTHAAVFPLVQGCEAGQLGPQPKAGATRVLPVCAMVCNFTKPTAAAPSLLRHEEVETLFHEFGHVTHCLCSTTRLNRFASFRCEMDFVEAPSQMLENWVWEPETLQMLSGHHTDHSKKLPMELALKLKNSQLAHAGLTNMRQIFLATFDQRLHQLPAKAPTSDSLTRRSAPEVASDDLIKTLHDEVLKIKHTPGTSFGASFGHLVGGYSSSYYGYLWSEVYAQDMFAACFEANPLDPAAGLRYRSIILGSGGSVDAKVFLRSFLGREPSSAAFLRSKGLAA